MKEVIYRGGIAKFEIPDDWNEEYEPEGGATFYRVGDDTGTLRLNVLSFKRKDDQSGEPLTNLGFRPFRDDLFLKMEEKEFTEEGTKCALVNWQIGYEVDAINFRIASFNFTVLEDKKKDPDTALEMKAITHILKTAEFGREQGVTGDYEHK